MCQPDAEEAEDLSIAAPAHAGKEAPYFDLPQLARRKIRSWDLILLLIENMSRMSGKVGPCTYC
jgi:hypothetical protein